MTTKTTTRRNAKPAAKKPAAKQEATKFSAAKVLLACGVTNAKVGRALLRANNVTRTEAAIKAFFAARAKAKKIKA